MIFWKKKRPKKSGGYNQDLYMVHRNPDEECYLTPQLRIGTKPSKMELSGLGPVKIIEISEALRNLFFFFEVFIFFS